MKKMRSPMVAKGYRLKSSTHQLIRKIQSMLSCTQEGVIGKAVEKYYAEIKKTELNREINHQSIQP